MRLGTNIVALKGHNNLNKINELKAKSLEKLQTGKRINGAQDDAAGLAISEKMKAQISGIKMAIRNTQDGQAMVMTAEGVMNEVTDILQRMREIVTQGANDTYGSTERAKIKTELDQLSEELDRISDNTKFNGKPLLNGTATGITLQVGPNSGETLVLNFDSVDSTSLGVDKTNLVVDDHTTASTTLETIDTALTNLLDKRSELGAMINRLDYTHANLNTMLENISAAESRISDVDMASEMMLFTKNNILSQSGNTMLAQAMQAPNSILQLLQQ